MTLDNGKRIVLMRLIGFISTVIYVLYVFLAYFPRVFRNTMTEKSVTLLTVVITVPYLLFLFWPVLRKYRYINFSANERKITLRWYKTGLMPGESRSIEIATDKFAGYEIKKRMLGLYHYLILYQQVQGRKAAYSPVSITALSKAQRVKICETLNGYKPVI